MKLDDLITPLHEMSESEIHERIRQIRTDRRDPILRKPKKATTSLRKRTEKAASSLSADQAAELLKLIGAE